MEHYHIAWVAKSFIIMQRERGKKVPPEPGGRNQLQHHRCPAMRLNGEPGTVIVGNPLIQG